MRVISETVRLKNDDPELARVVVRLGLAEDAGAVRHGDLAGDHRLHQALHLRWQVLSVRVQGDDDARARVGEQPIAGAKRGAAAAIDQVAGDDRAVLGGDLAGAVPRAVVDDENRGLEPADLIRNPVEDIADAVGLVVGGDQHAELVPEALRMARGDELLPGEPLEHLGELAGDPRPLRQRSHDQQEQDQDARSRRSRRSASRSRV